jgi:hypothetical protein
MIEGTLAARVPALRGGISWPLRAALRSAYVVCTTAVAVAMPFFAGAAGGLCVRASTSHSTHRTYSLHTHTHTLTPNPKP